MAGIRLTIQFSAKAAQGGLRVSWNPRSPQGGFTLIVGRTSYLLQEHGRQMIMGPIGEALPAVLRNPDRIRGCTLKMLIESRTELERHLT